MSDPLPYALRFCALSRIGNGRRNGFAGTLLSGPEVQKLVESIEAIHLENNRLKDELNTLKTLPGCSVRDALECIQSGQTMKILDNPGCAFRLWGRSGIEVFGILNRVSLHRCSLSVVEFLNEYKTLRFTPYTGE